MSPSKIDAARQVALVPHLQPTCRYRIVALDPSVKGNDGKALTAEIEIPYEQLSPGARGYRVQVVDYDASRQILYQPASNCSPAGLLPIQP